MISSLSGNKSILLAATFLLAVSCGRKEAVAGGYLDDLVGNFDEPAIVEDHLPDFLPLEDYGTGHQYSPAMMDYSIFMPLKYSEAKTRILAGLPGFDYPRMKAGKNKTEISVCVNGKMFIFDKN